MEFLKFHYIKLVHFLNCTSHISNAQQPHMGSGYHSEQDWYRTFALLQEDLQAAPISAGHEMSEEGCAWRVPHYHFSRDMAKTQESNVVAGQVGEMSLLLAEDQTGDQIHRAVFGSQIRFPTASEALCAARLEGRGPEFSSASALSSYFVLGSLVRSRATQSHTSQAPSKLHPQHSP